MKHLNKHTRISDIEYSGNRITKPEDISNLFADHFQNNSANSNYSDLFLDHKTEAEATPLDMHEDNNTDPINLPISSYELEQAMAQCPLNSSPGPDDICYAFLVHLPEEAKEYLLKIYNAIWTSQTFPSEWLKSVITPILKDGKPKAQISSYRPISLTCTMGKLLEKIINKRLMWILERRNLISPLQSGFRQGRSTIDNIINLESEIQESFANKEILVAIFFDIEKAYDMTWRFSIMRRLQQWGFRGNIMAYIKNFLSARSIQVRIGGTLSTERTLQNGIPQGSTLSVTLFLIAFNSVAEKISRPVRSTIYADDLVIYLRGKNIKTVQDTLQSTLNALNNWTRTSGFKFSPLKTKCIVFSKQKVTSTPKLTLYGNELTFEKEVRFLGVTLDQKLTWKSHLRQLKLRCSKVLNLMKALASHRWGADTKTLIHIYLALIRSKIDYGAIAYMTADRKLLKSVDVIQNSALRIALGAFRSTPTDSLHCLSEVMPLDFRRDMQTLQYAIRITHDTHNPNHHFIHSNRLRTIFDQKPHLRPPFHERLKRIQSKYSIEMPLICHRTNEEYLPWIAIKTVISTELSQLNKSDTHPTILANHFKAITSRYQNYIFLYTDASKYNGDTGFAVVTPTCPKQHRLSSNCSVYTGELYAIMEAVQYAVSNQNTNYLICSDSLSALQAIRDPYSTNPIVYNIRSLLYNNNDTSQKLILMFTPSHVGIAGNEKADMLAKEATRFPQDPRHNYCTPADAKTLFKNLITRAWNDYWTSCDSKLKTIKSSVNQSLPLPQSRRLQVIVNRLRLGHTRLTHSHLLSSQPATECAHCHVPLTVHHIILDCPLHNENRARHGIPPTIEQAIGTNITNVNKTVTFLRNLDILKKI